jgi:excisionase family DNA binding protein
MTRTTEPQRPADAITVDTARSVTQHRKERQVEDLLLTPEEAAESLKVSRDTVYTLIRLRALPSVKIGRSRRIPAASLRAYVERLTEECA